MATVYKRTARTGGAPTALDNIDGAGLVDGDMAFVTVGGTVYTYLLDDDLGGAESDPYVVTPDANAGTKRWALQSDALSALPAYATAALPAATAGRVARLTDGTRGIWTANGTAWYPVGPYVNVKDFGAVGDCTNGTDGTDDTTAIAAAIAAAGANGCILLPAGGYRITSGLVISLLRQHLLGAGVRATTIWFNPSANGTAITVQAPAAGIYWQGSIRGLSIMSADSTYTKIGIDIVDSKQFLVEFVEIGGTVAVGGTNYWSGGTGSIGLRYRGRDSGTVRNFYVAADKPVQFADNPNNAIDVDHFHGQDWDLTANANPCITVNTGVNLTHMTLDGEQAWVKGTGGFYWVDTTSVAYGAALTIANVRHEQADTGTTYLVRIEHNTGLDLLRIQGIYGGLNINGIKLRKVRMAEISNYEYVDVAKTSLDVDATVAPLKLDFCLGNTGSLVSITGLTPIIGARYLLAVSTLPVYALYDAPVDDDLRLETSMAVGSPTLSLAADATASIGDLQTCGLLLVTNHIGTSAIYALRAGSAPIEVADPDSWYTVTKDNGGTVNIYWDTANYYIQNKSATDPLKLRYLIVGSKGGF